MACSITAKDVQKLKSLNGRGEELQIGLALIYCFVSLDSKITLTTDKKQLLTANW